MISVLPVLSFYIRDRFGTFFLFFFTPWILERIYLFLFFPSNLFFFQIRFSLVLFILVFNGNFI